MAYKFRSGKAELSGSMTTDDVAYFGDTDTLIDWENDYISFKTNNTSVLTVSGSKVGIGTTSPGSNLHVKGDDARIRIDGDTDSHPGLELSENGTRKWIIYNNYTNDNLTFKTNSNTRMSIEQDGNVGIGTATPDYTLDVAGNIGLDEYIYHNGDADTSLRFETNAITFQCGGSTLLQVNGTSGNKRVGVGLTDPTSTLSVEGSFATQVKDVTGTSTTLDDAASLVLMGSDNSNCTVSLPAASSCTGRIYTFKRLATTNESVLMRITPNGSDEIDGNNSSMSLDTQYNTLTLQSDGSRWWITNEVHMGGG